MSIQLTNVLLDRAPSQLVELSEVNTMLKNVNTGIKKEVSRFKNGDMPEILWKLTFFNALGVNLS